MQGIPQAQDTWRVDVHSHGNTFITLGAEGFQWTLTRDLSDDKKAAIRAAAEALLAYLGDNQL